MLRMPPAAQSRGHRDHIEAMERRAQSVGENRESHMPWQ
jgi:hypothetical protein